jgi:type I restriction enzyme S subunit
MRDNWKEVRLGDVANTRNGAGVKQESFAESGIPLARISDFTDGGISLENCLFVAEEFAGRWANYVLQEGDVIIATVGSWPPNWASVVGKVVRVIKESVGAIQNQNTCCVLAKPELSDQRFLFYILRSKDFLFYAGNASAGSANQARLPVKNVENYSFLLPPLEEQRHIAHILGTLDDKIELNRRQNETLESLARALFQSWFVDFDPVRAKANGEDEAVICQRLGLSPQVLALFPAALEESALGEVPAGWEVGPFSKLADFVNKPVKPFDKPEKVWEHFSLPAFDANQTPSFEEGSTIKSGKFAVPADAVLVSKLNPRIPRIWLPNPETADAIASTEFMPFVARKVGEQALIYCLVTSEKFQAEFMQRVKGSTGSHQRVGPTDILKIPVVAPDSAIRLAFVSLIQPFLKRQAESLAESRTLAALRDELLPHLLSGKLSI